MGMTIDKSTRILVDRYIDTYVICGGANYNPTINITREDREAFQVAIETMRKYQKIENIINAPIGGTSAKYNAIVNLIKYSEVIEHGNDE